jgi:hypothetical protein
MTFTTVVLNGMLDDIDVLATHASIHTADPGGTGAHEVSGGSYVRKALTWPAASSGIKTAAAVTFQIPAGVTITHFGLWSAASGGSFLGGQALVASVVFVAGAPYSLTVSAVTDAPSAVPSAGGTMTGGLTLSSTAAGGSDTTDSTSRIDLTSHQSNGTHFYGELIRLNVINNPDAVGGAKGMIAWRLPRPPDGTDESTLRTVTWIGAHWNSQASLGTIHGHWSIETPDASDSLQTRLEILISNQAQTAIGSDKTLILTNAADFVVRCDNSQVLRLKSGSGAIKAIEWSNADWGGSGVRWQIRQNGTAESGSNAGSDWELARFNDSGVEQDKPIVVTRSNGKVTIGGTAGTAGSLQVNRASTGTAFTIDTYQAAAGGTGTTAYQALTKDTTSRVVNSLVATDVTARFVLFADGKTEWGPGGSTARDTNLYRSAADTLATDDSLTVGASLTVTTATVSPTVRGSTASGGTLTLNSTSNATKGKIVFGTSAYDEVNNRLGVGNAIPAVALDVTGQITASTIMQSPTQQGGTGSAGTLTLTSTSNATKGKILFGTSAYDEANNRLGVGNASPTVPLDVTGNTAISGTLTLGGDATLTRSAAGVITTTAELWRTASNTFTGAYLAQVTGDAVPRLNIQGDGKHEWGDGSTTRDTNLYRSAAGVLKTDTALHVTTVFRHLGTTLGFYNTAAATKQAVTGSRGGNAALASLLTALATVGLVTDSSTA